MAKMNPIRQRHDREQAVAPKRMWEGGPLRRWSAERVSGGQIPYDRGGFVGVYVCDVGKHDSPMGLYRSPDGLWKCAEHGTLTAQNSQ